ncbi:hypothetical protein AYI68_g1649, partial [Smittium mucronatum]
MILNSKAAFIILLIISRNRKTGITQADLGFKTKIDPRSIFHYLKVLETHNLIKKIQLFVDGFNTNLIFLNSHKKSEIKNDREFFIQGQSKILKIDKKNLLSKENFVEGIKDLKSNSLGVSTNDYKDPNNVEELVFLKKIKNLILDALSKAPDNIMFAEDLIEVIGLEGQLKWHRTFFNRQLRSLENSGKVENLKVKIDKDSHEYSRQLKPTRSSSKRCIRLISPQSPKNPRSSYRLGDNSSFKSNISDFSSDDYNSDNNYNPENSSDYKDYISPDTQHIFEKLKNYNRGLLSILSPDLQIIYLIYISGSNGIKTRNLAFLLNHLSHKYISRTITKKFLEPKQGKPLIKFIYENIGKESSKRFFPTDELFRIHKNIFPQSLTSFPDFPISSEDYKKDVNSNFGVSNIDSIKDSVFYIPPKSDLNSVGTDLSLPEANLDDNETSTPGSMPLERWDVFSYDHLKKISDDGSRVTITKLIREQAVLDLLKDQSIIDITGAFMTSLESVISGYQSKLVLGLVDTDIHYPDSGSHPDISTTETPKKKRKVDSSRKGLSKLTESRILFDFDLKLLAKSASTLTNKMYKICKKTLVKTFSDLESYGYGNCRHFLVDRDIVNSNSFRPKHDLNGTYSKDQIFKKTLFDKKSYENKTARTILIISSVNPDGKQVEDYINASRDPSNYINNLKVFKHTLIQPTFLSVQRSKKEDNKNISFKDIRSPSINRSNPNPPPNTSPLSSKKSNSKGIKRLFSSYEMKKDLPKSQDNKISDSEISKRRKKYDLSNISFDGSSNIPNQSTSPVETVSSFFADYSSIALSLDLPSIIEANEEKLLAYPELTVEFLFTTSKMLLAKEIHLCMIEFVYRSNRSNDTVYSIGRFSVSNLLNYLPLRLVFKFVKWKKVSGAIYEFLNGGFDKYIKSIPKITNSTSIDVENKPNESDISINDRLNVPLGELPISVLKLVLRDSYKIRSAIRPILGILIRLELLRPLDNTDLVETEPVPESLNSHWYMPDEQLNFLGLSDLNHKVKNKGLSSRTGINDLEVSSSLDQPKIEWDKLFDIYSGYQLMSSVKLRDFSKPSILPAYIEDRIYNLLDDSHLSGFWDDLRNISIYPSALLSTLSHTYFFSTNGELLLSESDLKPKNQNFPPTQILPGYISDRDPIFMIKSNAEWGLDVSRMTYPQRIILNSYIDFENRISPFSQDRLLNFISIQVCLDPNLIKTYYKKYELEWLTKKRKIKLDDIEGLEMVSLKAKMRKLKEKNSSHIGGVDKRNENDSEKIIKIINVGQKQINSKFCELLKFQNEIDKCRKTLGNFSVFDLQSDINSVHHIIGSESYSSIFEYLRSKGFKEFKKKDIKKYPEMYILYHAYMSFKCHEIEKYMEIYRNCKSNTLNEYLMEMIDFNADYRPNKLNGFESIFDLSSEYHSSDFNQAKSSFLTPATNSSPNHPFINSGKKTDSNNEGDVYLLQPSEYLISQEMCVKLGDLLTNIFSRKTRKRFDNIFDLKRQHSLYKWSVLDSNRLLTSVAILNSLNRSHSLPLHWNLILLCFKHDVRFYSIFRLRLVFNHLMKIPKNVEYFNKIGIIYNKIRPLVAKMGFLSDVDKIMNSEAFENNSKGSGFLSKYNKPKLSSGNNNISQATTHLIDDNSDKPIGFSDTNKNSGISIMRRIDLFRETSYTVGLIFYFGAPFLLDALGFNKEYLDQNLPSIDSKDNNALLNFSMKSGFPDITNPLPSSIDLLYSNYFINSAFSGKIIMNGSQINKDPQDFVSNQDNFVLSGDPQNDQSDRIGLDYRFFEDNCSPSSFQGYFYEDAIYSYSSLKKQISQSYQFMQNLRMSWLTTLNHPNNQSTIYQLDIQKIRNDFSDVSNSAKDIFINRLLLSWLALDGYLDFSVEKIKTWLININIDRDNNVFSRYGLSPFSLNNYELFEGANLVQCFYSSPADDTDRLYGFYPIQNNASDLFKYSLESHDKISELSNFFDEGIKITTNNKLNVSNTDMAHGDLNPNNEYDDVESYRHSDAINVDSNLCKSSVSRAVDSYLRNTVLQQLIFKLIFTSDDMYNSEFFFNLILHNSGRRFNINYRASQERLSSLNPENAQNGFFEIVFHSNNSKRSHKSVLVVEIYDFNSSDNIPFENQKQKSIEDDLSFFSNVLESMKKSGIIIKRRRSDTRANLDYWEERRNDKCERFLEYVRGDTAFKNPDIPDDDILIPQIDIDIVEDLPCYESPDNTLESNDKLSTLSKSSPTKSFKKDDSFNAEESSKEYRPASKTLKAPKLLYSRIKDRVQNFTVRSLSITERYVTSLRTRFPSECFVSQASFSASKWNSILSKENLKPDLHSDKVNGNKHHNIYFSGNPLLLKHPSPKFQTNAVSNQGLTDLDCIIVNGDTSSGEFAFLVEKSASYTLTFDICIVSQFKFTNRYSGFWRNVFSNQTHNTVYANPTFNQSNYKDSNSLEIILRNKIQPKNKGKINDKYDSLFFMNEIQFLSLVNFVSGVVFDSGPLGTTQIDIKLCVLLRYHPPYFLPSDYDINLAIRYLDLNNSFNTGNLNDKIIQTALKKMPNSSGFKLDFEQLELKYIYRVGLRETRYVSSCFYSFWSIGFPNYKSLPSKKELISRAEMVNNGRFSMEKNYSNLKLGDELYNNPIIDENGSEPNPSPEFGADGSTADNSFNFQTDDMSSYKSIPSRI